MISSIVNDFFAKNKITDASLKVLKQSVIEATTSGVAKSQTKSMAEKSVVCKSPPPSEWAYYFCLQQCRMRSRSGKRLLKSSRKARRKQL